MEHGYAGARTMGSDFLDNLWGWQITSPQVLRSSVWDEVNEVYFQDRHGLGLDDFLEEGHNVHVKTHMQAIALLAAKRRFWEADVFTRQATWHVTLPVTSSTMAFPAVATPVRIIH